jgi:hypothetical protein
VLKLIRAALDLDELNHTELVALAKWCGLPASRGMPRWMLKQSLETFTPASVDIPVDNLRAALSAWLKKYWGTLRMQMPKKVCPDCFKCKDLQVLDCYAMNEAQIKPGPSRR